MAVSASDWLRHLRFLLWSRWIEFNETWQVARSQISSNKYVFSGRSEKQDGRPGLWLAETFSTFHLKPLTGIEQKHDRNQDLNVLDHDMPMFIRIYFQQYIFLPKNQEKLWSEEIINKIALKLSLVPIFLSMSFWSLV